MNISVTHLIAAVFLFQNALFSQNITDAKQPPLVRNSENFKFEGGSLRVFKSKLEQEFSMEPGSFSPILARYLRLVEVPAFEVKAKEYSEVLLKYNELSKKNPKMGVWLLPGRTPGLAANSPARFHRDAFRPGGRFEFLGGSLHDFIDEIHLQFGINLDEIASFPNDVNAGYRAIPKMRLKASEFTTVLALYNEISKESDSSLGRWIVKKVGEETATVIFEPESPVNSSSERLVRAFPLRATEPILKQLRDSIEVEASRLHNELMEQRRRVLPEIHGRISYHEATGIVVVSGPKQYVEIAAEIISAYRTAAGQEPPVHTVKQKENGN